VTIWSARHNHKIYGETDPYFLLDQSRARMFSVVYGYGYGYGTPVETLLERLRVHRPFPNYNHFLPDYLPARRRWPKNLK
jgi:hypothetical protein